MTVYTDYQFDSGEDYSNLAGPDAAIPGMPAQLLPDSANMGAASMPVGINQTDAMDGLTGDGTFQFVDAQDNRQFTHPDTMSGLAGHGEVEVLAQEQVYAEQPSLPFSPLPDTSNPLLEGE